MLRVCVFLSVIWIEKGRKFAENKSERKEKEETRWAKKTTICWKQKKTIYTDISIEIAAFFSLSPCRHIDITRLEWALELTSGRWASHTDWHVTRNVDWDEKAKLNIWIIFVWTFHEKKRVKKSTNWGSFSLHHHFFPVWQHSFELSLAVVVILQCATDELLRIENMRKQVTRTIRFKCFMTCVRRKSLSRPLDEVSSCGIEGPIHKRCCWAKFSKVY